MAWTAKKQTNWYSITFQGVDNYADLGDDTKGLHVTLGVNGVKPDHTPMAEPRSYVGGGYKACRQKWRDFLVQLRAFSVEASATSNDYSDFMLLRNVFAYKHVAIVACDLNRACFPSGNYWDAAHLPIVVELMGKMSLEPNFDTGREELTLELREPLLYNPA